MSDLKLNPTSLLATIFSLALLGGGPAAAEKDIDLTSFDLEELMSMKVTSVSKKSERAFEAPAAAFVITSEDIRRSGNRTLPELLRMVPGVQVARLSSSQYAITVRGFNGTFVDKLLVLIDGRSVYTPLFAGVFWGIQDTPLADIDRIEVIRGPGGTVWGANAVNGVINIVTKSAADTKGWHVEVGVGDYERGGSGMARYGGSIGENIDFRVYLKQFDREKLKDTDDDRANDDWNQIRTGFRIDARVGESGDFTLQGDLYDGETGSTVSGGETVSTVGGGNALARYTHTFSDTHNASVQFYYDRTDRFVNIITYELDTIDLELKHQIKPLPWLGFVWGGEYRYRHDDAKGRNPAGYDTVATGIPFDGFTTLLGLPDVLAFDPSSRKTDLFSGFVQAEARALEDKIRFTLGTKLEDNDSSGFEVQPSARLAYVPNNTMTVWGSASRAVRTPSRANEDLETLDVSSNDTPIRDSGNRDIESEDLMAYEAGIRVQPTNWLHFDVAAYYNDYDDLITQDVTEVRDVIIPIPPFGPVPFAVVERSASNEASAKAWGIEFFARAQILEDHSILEKWWLDATYTYIDVDVDREGGVHLGQASSTLTTLGVGKDDTIRGIKGQSEAHHTIGLRSHMSFACDLEFDLSYYYTSKVKDVRGDGVDAYHKVDVRTAWNATENVAVEFTVENLLDGEHSEWNTEQFISSTKVPRMFYGKVTLDF